MKTNLSQTLKNLAKVLSAPPMTGLPYRAVGKIVQRQELTTKGKWKWFDDAECRSEVGARAIADQRNKVKS